VIMRLLGSLVVGWGRLAGHRSRSMPRRAAFATLNWCTNAGRICPGERPAARLVSPLSANRDLPPASRRRPADIPRGWSTSAADRVISEDMPIHWNYMPALEGKRSEIAHRTADSELFQAGHFHDQAQIVAVFAGWRSFATPFGTIRAEAGDVLAIPSGMFHAPRTSHESSVLVLFLDKDHPIAKEVRQPRVANGQGARRVDEILDCVATRLVCHQIPEQFQLSSMLTPLVTENETSLRGVAESFGYSPDGFPRMFCRSVGTTPA